MSKKEERAHATFKDTVHHTAGIRYKHSSLTAAKTLTVHDSGKTFVLNTAGGFTVTLPSATATGVGGCVFTFLVGTAPSGADYIIKGGTDDKMTGLVISSDGGDADAEGTATADQCNLKDGVALLGDRCVVYCDGTAYYSLAFTKADAGATYTG